MLEKIQKSILKKIMIAIIEIHGADSSKVTDEHVDNLWKISASYDGEKKNEKIREYLKAYIL